MSARSAVRAPRSLLRSPVIQAGEVAPPASANVLYDFRFNEGSGTTVHDHGPLGLHLQFQQTQDGDVPEWIDEGIDFSSGGMIAPYNSALNDQQQVIALIVNKPVSTGNSNLITRMDYDNPPQSLQLLLSELHPSFTLYGVSENSGFIPAESVGQNTWNLLVYVYDGLEGHVRVNGQEVGAPVTLREPLRPTTSRLYFGVGETGDNIWTGRSQTKIAWAKALHGPLSVTNVTELEAEAMAAAATMGLYLGTPPTDPLQITTNLTELYTVEPTSIQFVKTGGRGVATWSASDLPAELTLNASGLLTGTLPAPGSENFTITVTDDSGSVSRVYNPTIFDLVEYWDYIEAGATNWIVPDTFTPIGAHVHVHAPGSLGWNGGAGTRRGGAGGAYIGDSLSNLGLSLTRGQVVPVQVAAGGSQTDSWFNSATTLLADAATNATSTTAGQPGLSGNCVGPVTAVKHSGGAGGNTTGGGTDFGGGGGGGAGGPEGSGKAGGAVNGGASAGGGGGGSNGGSSTAGGSATGTTAGAGGKSSGNVNGGAGATSGAAAGNGSSGSGGGGGSDAGSFRDGGNGSQQNRYGPNGAAQYRGPGGGGGGRSGGSTAKPGDGGGWGGGSGGGGGTAAVPAPGGIAIYWKGPNPPPPPDDLTVSGAPDSATIGAAYSFTFGIAGGTPPYSGVLSGDPLPDGLTFTSPATISGTPEA